MPGHALSCPACGMLFVTVWDLQQHQAAEARREVENDRRGRRPIPPGWGQVPPPPRPRFMGGPNGDGTRENPRWRNVYSCHIDESWEDGRRRLAMHGVAY